MAFFRKKRIEETSVSEEMPQLPELPPMPELPSFPEFPSLNSAEEIEGGEMQKAIGESGEEKEEPIPRFQPQISQIPQFSRIGNEQVKIEKPARLEPRTLEISEKFGAARPREVSRKAEPLFVRIDKFETALENFGEVKKKIREIERLLQSVREIKAREEEDLSEWERELETIKARIDSIDRDVFEKV